MTAKNINRPNCTKCACECSAKLSHLCRSSADSGKFCTQFRHTGPKLFSAAFRLKKRRRLAGLYQFFLRGLYMTTMLYYLLYDVARRATFKIANTRKSRFWHFRSCWLKLSPFCEWSHGNSAERTFFVSAVETVSIELRSRVVILPKIFMKHCEKVLPQYGKNNRAYFVISVGSFIWVKPTDSDRTFVRRR